MLPFCTVRKQHVAAPAGFLARAAATHICGAFDVVHNIAVEKILISFALRRGQGAEDDSVTLLRKLVSEDAFHPSKEELRQQILHEGFSCLPSLAQLVYSSIMGLTHLERIADAGLPRCNGPELARVGPVE